MKTFRGLNVPDGFGEKSLNCGDMLYPNCTKCSDCIVFGKNIKHALDYLKYSDLTKIETPFGLLPKDIKEELKKAWNGKYSYDSNIEFFYYAKWENDMPNWVSDFVYRLSPTWKPEEVVEMTVAEVEKLVGKKVKIIKDLD